MEQQSTYTGIATQASTPYVTSSNWSQLQTTSISITKNSYEREVTAMGTKLVQSLQTYLQVISKE